MKKKWIAFGIVAALLIAVLVIVLRFTKKQTKGIADGKYMIWKTGRDALCHSNTSE